MDNETYYFNVTVDYNKIKIEDLRREVEEFNEIEGYMAFDKVDAGGKLHFIYQAKDCADEEDAKQLVESLAYIFKTEFSWERVPANQLDPHAKRRLDCTVGGCRPKTSYEGRKRWTVRSQQDIIREMEGTSGYDKLRDFLYKFNNYICNNKLLGHKGNYNLAIVMDSNDYDKKRIVNTVYDLLCAHDIVMDYQIIERGFEPFLDGDGSDEQFYYINEDWDQQESFNPFRRNPDKMSIATMRAPKGHFITFMSTEQYSELKDLVGFNLTFPHQVVMPELNCQDKFSLLQSEARELGFALDDSFTKHDLLQRDMSDLLQGMMRAVTQKLYEKNCLLQVLQPEDFRLATQANQKAVVKGDAMTELQALIGLKNVKQLLKKICAFLRKRGRKALPSLHMVFRGNPGTGKTTVARIIGKLFAEIGLLSPKGIFVEADRRALVGKYVGHSAPRTAKMVKKAMGGVLFIDEAYSLDQKDGFSHETVATLVKLMEDHRNDFVCIMAGYTDEMNGFLDMNPGMRERIQFYIDFPDYTAGELHDIFLQYSEKEHYRVAVPAMQLLDEHFNYMVDHKDRHFANARLVRKVFEHIRLNQAMRSDGDDIAKEDVIATFEEPDMVKYIQTVPCKIKSIGFVA